MKKKITTEQNVKKDIFWNTLGTGINAFNSLLFMIIVTRINGVNDAGIFTLAFSTASLFNVIGNYSGRVYQVTDKSQITDNDYFFNKLITCLMMLIISLCFVLINRYRLWKSSIILILCLLKTFEAFAEVIYAFFQKEYCLYKVGISFTLKNLIGLTIFLLTNLLTKNVLLSTLALTISYLIIMFLYDFQNINLKAFSLKQVKWNNVFLIFKKGFFSFSLSFLTMYILNIPRYIIDSQMEEKFSTIFGILIMPASVMVLIAQFILHPFLMNLKENLSNHDLKTFTTTIYKMIACLLLFGVIVLLIAYFLGIPVLGFIYNLNLENYQSSLMLVILGAIMYGITIILSNILISMRITFKQALIYTINTVVSLILSNYLITNNGIEGACQSYCIIMFTCLLCFIALTIVSINKKRKEGANHA